MNYYLCACVGGIIRHHSTCVKMRTLLFCLFTLVHEIKDLELSSPPLPGMSLSLLSYLTGLKEDVFESLESRVSMQQPQTTTETQNTALIFKGKRVYFGVIQSGCDPGTQVWIIPDSIFHYGSSLIVFTEQEKSSLRQA